jgi:alpha-L-fucosidase
MNKSKRLSINLLVIILIASLSTSLHAEVKLDSVTSKYHKKAIVETSRTAWWEKARFGMFIHWGVYTIPAGDYNGKYVPGLGEWIMSDAKIPVATYKDYAKKFNPTEYNPEQWVHMAKSAGMKYIVITTKHHDGFALFDSKASNWNVVKATPYGKDLIRPLAEACRKYGMKLGFYYSQANDWGNKGGAIAHGDWDPAHKGNFDDYIDKVAIPQVKEILTNYGDVCELWWDVPTDMSKQRAAKFLPLLKLQPQIITNDRLGGDVKGDLFTPEQYIPATGIKGLWETCMTMNDTWGFKTNDHNWKTSAALIRNLIETASKGGNYLLNVGPEASGKFPPEIISRLEDIGKWMKINSESIYETTASPFKVLPWGRATTKVLADGNTNIYLHVYNWPEDGKLIVQGLQNSVVSATLLANGTSIGFGKLDGNLFLNVPINAADLVSTVIKVTIKGNPEVTPYVQTQEANGTITLLPGLAEFKVQNGGDAMRAEGASDQNIGYWVDPNSSASWNFVVKQPGTYNLETYVSALNSSKFKLSTGKETLSTVVESTGGYGSYKKVSLGTFNFTTAGNKLIQLSSDTQNWNPINIKTILITPAK